MQRFHGIDAYGIYSETPTSPFVTLKVAIYRPTHEDDVPDISELRSFVRAGVGMPGAAIGSMRVVRVPLDIHHPVWVADPDFSPDDHIYHVALPSPGDKAQLCNFLSDLMGRPLDPDRPLWEVWLVEGLEGGRIAMVSKVHHSLADGKTIAALIEKSHREGLGGEARPAGFAAEPIPGNARLIRDGLLDLLKTWTVEIPRFVRYLRQTRKARAARREAGERGVAPFSAPYTVLNEGGGRYRIYRYETFSLSGFKALSKSFGCTINTLVMGVCSEALKRYLLDVGTLPSAPLIAAMPVGDQGGRHVQMVLSGKVPHNSVSVALVPLFQDVSDFGERLQAIQRASEAAVEDVRRTAGTRLEDYLEFLPSAFARLVNAAMSRRQARKQNPYANVVISNVPGPREPLQALDGRLELVELLSTGNLADAGSINITVWSYVDNLCFSFYLRKDALPEPEKLTRHARDVVEELLGRSRADAASEGASGSRGPAQPTAS